MPRYSVLYQGNELTKLHDGLEVIERVGPDVFSESVLDIWLYCIVTNKHILDIAAEAIVGDDAEEDRKEHHWVKPEEPPAMNLIEIAVALPLSSRNIDKLHGSGYPLRDLNFAYRSGKGEGAREGSFFGSNTAYTISVNSMGTQAIAPDESELDEFLKNEGSKLPQQRKIQRNEEATTDEFNEKPEPHQPQVIAALNSIVENFLG